MFPETHKILYATDLSPNSPGVLKYAINSAIKNDAEIIILYVFEHEDPTRRAMLDLYLDKNKRQKIFAEHTTGARELIKMQKSHLTN